MPMSTRRRHRRIGRIPASWNPRIPLVQGPLRIVIGSPNWIVRRPRKLETWRLLPNTWPRGSDVAVCYGSVPGLYAAAGEAERLAKGFSMRSVQGLFIVMGLATTAFAQPAGRLTLADVVADAIRANPAIAAAEQRSAAA